MSTKIFKHIQTSVVPLPIENIDTDQIIPARFLKATTRDGFGNNLFRDWRFDNDGNPKQDFVLNDPTYSGKIWLPAKTLVAAAAASMLPGPLPIMVLMPW
jgi:3-isopropylmalate/(R)-2-methylmalate dehydratase small subunit